MSHQEAAKPTNDSTLSALTPAVPATGPTGGRSPTGAPDAGTAGVRGPATPPQRYHAHHKRAVVLRLFAGEPVDLISRQLGIPIGKLEKWRHSALDGMAAGLAERDPDAPLQRKLDDANRLIGELTMERELLWKRTGATGPFPERKSRK